MKHLMLVFLLFLCTFYTDAQKSSKIDSLKRVLLDASADSTRFQANLRLSGYFVTQYADSSIFLWK